MATNGGTSFPRLVRRAFVFAAATLFLVGLIWVCVLAAGTPWAVLVAAGAVAVAFWADRLDQHRYRSTPLQRFEEREGRRAA